MQFESVVAISARALSTSDSFIRRTSAGVFAATIDRTAMKISTFHWSLLAVCLVLVLGGRPSFLSIETVVYDSVTGVATFKLTNTTPGIVWFLSHQPWTPAQGYQREVNGELESLYILGCGVGLVPMPLLPLQSVTYDSWLPKGASRPLIFMSSATQKNVAVLGEELDIGNYFYPNVDFNKMLFREQYAEPINDAANLLKQFGQFESEPLFEPKLFEPL